MLRFFRSTRRKLLNENKTVKYIKYAVGEVLLIMVGILLAFSIDAWWQDTSESSAMREMLVALEAEFSENVEDLLQAKSGHGLTAAAGHGLLKLTGPDVDLTQTDAVAELIGTFWIPVKSRVSSGALSSLISSGVLPRISNGELRSALSSWTNRVTDLVEVEEGASDAQELVHSHLRLYIPQLGLEIRNGFATMPELKAEFLQAAPAKSRFESDYAGLLGDRQFESAVVERVTGAMIAAWIIEREMFPQAESILSLIRSELSSL